MGKKMVPKIILEGTRLTQKTELAFLLNEHPRIVGERKYRYHSPIISAEWCAFTNFPWGRGLINYEKQEEQLAYETYQTWMKLLELQRYYSWIIDRFHLSTQMYQMIYRNNAVDFYWLEERLQALNFRLILLHRSHESFEIARKERLKVSGNPSQYEDLTKFYREQDELIELAQKSRLKSLILDVSDSNLNVAATSIADWMEESGGIYLEE